MNAFRKAVVVACKGDYDHVRATLSRTMAHHDRIMRSGVYDVDTLADLAWARKRLEQELNARYVVRHVA